VDIGAVRIIKQHTKERPRSNQEKTLLLQKSTDLLREHFDAHRGTEIDLAAMVTTRNHNNQQNNQEENSSTILGEVRRELEMIRKLCKEDQLRQTSAFDTLQKENKRLQQRLERMEKEKQNREVRAEGEALGMTPKKNNPRRKEESQPDGRREEPRHESQREVPSPEE